MKKWLCRRTFTLLSAVLLWVAGSSAALAATAAIPAPSRVMTGLMAAHLPEPLVATGPTTAAGDAALLRAVQIWQTRSDPDDFSSLTGFLAAHPRSAWRAAVLTNLGIVYRHYGYLSRALDAWQQAWDGGKDATRPRAKALVDRAVGELVVLEAGLGRKEQLSALLKEIGDRPVSGPATELVQAGRDALTVMKTDPKHLYLCGPMALKALMLAQHVDPARVRFLDKVRAGPNGTSLAELAVLAKTANFALQPVFRKPGERVPVPSVVHWKVGHFSAIVAQRNGWFEIEDRSLARRSQWVTRGALDAEASGYFLVPAQAGQAAPWRKVAMAEAASVRGAGPIDLIWNLIFGGCPTCGCPMCQYSISESTVSLTLTDWPVGYTPPKGPSPRVMITYNQREVEQPANFDYFNVSQKWTINWLTYIRDDPKAPGSNVVRFFPDGGAEFYSGYDASTGAFGPAETDSSMLVRKKGSPITYERFLRDGTVETYAESDGSAIFPRNIFLSRVTDPRGNSLILDYDKVDGRVRLAALVDATGRKTIFSYGSSASPLLISRITDPFGRSAELAYDRDGRLTSITDVIGLTSKFTYDASSLVESLTTPYGTMRFAFGTSSVFGGTDNKRFLNITDPLGYGERDETFEPTPVPSYEPVVPQLPPGKYAPFFNAYLQYRNSFHWNKHQYALAGCTPSGGCNYTDARITHFTHDKNNTSTEWYTVESQKEPLESRIWYNYPGQSIGGIGAGASGTYDAPVAISRVLDNGQTQLMQIAYNAFGNPTQYIDPVGRTTTLTYAANEIDVDRIAQNTASGPQTVARFTYNDRHEPLTYTDTAGRTTHYAYNAAGQLTSLTDALGQTTRYEYNATGDLVRIINANGKLAASFAYGPGNDDVTSYTDAGGWTVKYDYDYADRLVRATYPDRTTDQYTYDKLDLASHKDRQGNVSRWTYDADRRLVVATDPLGHVTKYGYYEDGTLKSLTDPDGHTTSWDIDIESRPTAKIYADGTRTTYTYENMTSRLEAETDALGQSRAYSWALDNHLAGITYFNALHPTPDVSFAYDPYFPRLTAMTDGSGTTDYIYVPIGKPAALQLEEEIGPLAKGTIGYAYDALDRIVARTVGGAPTETFAYDEIWRLAAHTDALGKFGFSYLGETDQLTKRQLIGGNVSTAWSYLPNVGDRRLKSVVNTPGREFDFATTPEDLITSIAEKKSGKQLQTWTYGYDHDYRLLAGNSSKGPKYGYTLDPADNITRFESPAGASAAVYNKVNELTTLAGKPLVYDADGELISDGVRSYSWDAENRLVGVTEPGTRTSFAYDGFDRRIAIATTKSGKTTVTHYIWCGRRICQSRSSGNAVARLYYDEGETIPASKAFLYYGPDQLGSVRDVYAKSAVFAMAQQYDYDPYGNPTVTPSTGPTTDFRYAGIFSADTGKVVGGLDLTQFRAYDPHIGRWLSRDPLGEMADAGRTALIFAAAPARSSSPLPISARPWPSGRWTARGADLYNYVSNDPINRLDPLGLSDQKIDWCKCLDQAGIWGCAGALAGARGGPWNFVLGFLGGSLGGFLGELYNESGGNPAGVPILVLAAYLTVGPQLGLWSVPGLINPLISPLMPALTQPPLIDPLLNGTILPNSPSTCPCR